MSRFLSDRRKYFAKNKLGLSAIPWATVYRNITKGMLGFLLTLPLAGTATGSEGSHGENPALWETVQAYGYAIATGDRIAATQRDFACLFKMRQAATNPLTSFPPPSDPLYTWCSDRREQEHERVIQQTDRGLENLWPGKGVLVDFADFQRFLIAETGARQLAPSFFVMKRIGGDSTEVPFTLEVLNTAPLPHASFRFGDYDPVVATPTTLVTVKVNYSDPINSPVANAQGEKDWVVPYKKPQGAVKAVTVKWVVLWDLKKLGFPTDYAVLDMPLEGQYGTTIPFVVEPGGFQQNSTEWWGPEDNPQAIQAAIQQAKDSSDLQNAIMLLNRVLIVDPQNQEALETTAHRLYEGMLAYGERLHGVGVPQGELAQRFNELYWSIQSQTDRFDLSLAMEMGGKPEPTPADYLYRMVPIMEALAALQPGDFENRLRLGLAYRWTNDQLAAISAPQELLTEVPPEQVDLRARILLELAWSRIGKVAWNRHFDDPDLTRGYEEAETAFQLTDKPLDKFTAAYAMAYSQAFTVDRDNKTMLKLLQEARRWFEQLPGASQEAWVYLLQNDTLKGFMETDPAFQSLLAAT